MKLESIWSWRACPEFEGMAGHTAAPEVKEQRFARFPCFNDSLIDRVATHHEVHEVERANAWVRMLFAVLGRSSDHGRICGVKNYALRAGIQLSSARAKNTVRGLTFVARPAT